MDKTYCHLNVNSSVTLCFPLDSLDSCKGRCGYETNLGFSCQCDSTCEAFEDCCYDYTSICKSTVTVFQLLQTCYFIEMTVILFYNPHLHEDYMSTVIIQLSCVFLSLYSISILMFIYHRWFYILCWSLWGILQLSEQMPLQLQV